MRRIEIKLTQPVVAPLLDFIKTIAEELREGVVVEPQFPDPDPQLQESWREELVGGQRDDAAVFMGLFDREFFDSGHIVITDENGDAILRAAAAMRLKLRLHFLKDISDEVLEKGDVPFEQLGPAEQQAYACYLFLATIQEIVIQHLDFAGGR